MIIVAETKKYGNKECNMKSIFAILISFLFVVTGYTQTRNVIVNTNNVVVQPTNFWSADASNARTGLGLDTAATNPASAFQPSSMVLSNLASSNALNLTNVRATNIVGTIALASNVSGVVAITNGGSGATTAGGARSNLSLDWSALTNSNSATSLLGYTANGQVVANTGTNVLTFTNAILFETNAKTITLNNLGFYPSTIDIGKADANGLYDLANDTTTLRINDSEVFLRPEAAESFRTNLGFSTNLNTLWTATNTSNAITGLFGSGTNPVVYNTNGDVVTPTNFWQNAPIKTTVYTFAPITNASTNISGARNIYIYSLATNITGVTATINLPTNGTTFNGDVATVIHRGTTSSVTTIKESGNTLISISNYDSAVKFINENGTWKFYHNISFLESLKFAGTNAALNIAQTRTNIGLGAMWLTNTNVTNFRTDIGLGSTNSPEFASVVLGTGALTISGGAEDDISIENESGGFEFKLTGSVALRLDGTANFYSAINFNNTTNAATTRTNLGLPLAALTNTNNASFQMAIFHTNTTPTNGANLGDAKGWIEISVITNSVTNSFRIPVFQ